MFSIGRARKLGTPSFRPTHLTDQPLRAGLSSPGTGYGGCGGYGGYGHLPRWDHEDLPAFPTFSQRSPNLQDLLNGVEFSVRSWWFLFGTMEWTHVKGTCSEQVGFRSLCQIAPNSCWSIWSIQKASCNRGIQSSLWQRPPTATTPSQASWPRHATSFQHITGATGGPKALWASYSTHGTTKPRRSNCPSRACHGSNSMPVHCLSRGKSNVGNQACGGNWHALFFVAEICLLVGETASDHPLCPFPHFWGSIFQLAAWLVFADLSPSKTVWTRCPQDWPSTQSAGRFLQTVNRGTQAGSPPGPSAGAVGDFRVSVERGECTPRASPVEVSTVEILMNLRYQRYPWVSWCLSGRWPAICLQWFRSFTRGHLSWRKWAWSLSSDHLYRGQNLHARKEMDSLWMLLNCVKLLNTKTLILYPHFDPYPFQWLDEPKDPVGPIPPISSRWSSSAAHLTPSH